MKRILILAAAIIFAVPAMSQTATIKVDKEGILKKINRSDDDIANPKKNEKANTWLTRGNVYSEAGTSPSSGLRRGAPQSEIEMFHGDKGVAGTKVVNGTEYATLTYPNFVVYMINDEVVFWDSNLVIKEGALDTAFDAYAKAYDLDKKTTPKVRDGILVIANEYKREAENYYGKQDFQQTAESFAKAYEYQLHPAVNEVDTASLYNAGLFFIHSDQPAKSEKYLLEALKYGYENEGETYYYLYHAYNSMEQHDKAKDILERGITRHPSNVNIVEGLISVYNVIEGANPSDIITLVQSAIKEQPDNAFLWNGLGTIYMTLEDYDEAIRAYGEAVKLKPDEFYYNFRYGYTFIEVGDLLNKEFADKAETLTSKQDYDKGLEEVNDVYAKSLPYLEKAHELDPSNGNTLELLKNVTFRLRERDGIQAKYDKYNELYKNLPEE